MLSNTVIVVSGVVRSGTSLVMQMLEKGGILPLTDDKPKADQHNPNGYYGHQATRQLQKNQDVIQEAVGKSIKVLAGFLPLLPKNYTYKIIFIERDLNEVWDSLQEMRKSNGVKIQDGFFAVQKRENFKRNIEKSKTWAAQHPATEILCISHLELIKHPLEQATRISAFLNDTVDASLMAKVVNPSLHRSKGTYNYMVTDRAPLAVTNLINQYVSDKNYCEIGIGEGHLLNLITGAKEKFGIEKSKYGCTRCKELYPHLTVKVGDFFKLFPTRHFDVCYMWITYPFCKDIEDKILEKKPNTTVLIGLNYYFHLDVSDKKRQRYMQAYPPVAKAYLWNENIQAHLSELQARGFDHTIVPVEGENKEIFSVAVVQKSN